MVKRGIAAAVVASIIPLSFGATAVSAQSRVTVPDSTRGSKKCSDDVRNRFGGHFKVYVTKGRKRVVCKRARAIVRTGINVREWNYFDWTKGGNGPWSDVWQRRDGRVVVAAIVRCVEGLDNDDDLPPCDEELGRKASVQTPRDLRVEAARGSSFTIRTSGGFIARIGPMRVTGATGGTLAGASAAFGSPSSVDPVGNGSSGCQVEWQRLRLKATFANFGIDSACSPSGGRLQTATVRSPRFRTTRGVRVGSKSSTIPRKHSNAEFVDGTWWIATVVPPYGSTDETPTIKAIVRRGRVVALSLYVGAAGD